MTAAMREAFTILYSRVVVEAFLILGVIGIIASRLRRRLRVSPEQRRGAPVLWLVNVTADARLHRRLRRLAHQAHHVAAGGTRHRSRHGNTAAQRLTVDLAHEIVNLDEHLIATRGLDFDAQQVVVKDIRADADRVEEILERVTKVIEREADDPSLTFEADPIGAIAQRVDQLEVAATSLPAPIETTALDSPG